MTRRQKKYTVCSTEAIFDSNGGERTYKCTITASRMEVTPQGALVFFDADNSACMVLAPSVWTTVNFEPPDDPSDPWTATRAVEVAL